MKPFIPSPISAISAALLYALLLGFSAMAGLVLPVLFELLRSWPHLAMLGFLGFATLPGTVIVVAHHLGSDRLDQLERLTASKRRGLLPGVESWSAGAHGWLVLYGTSVLTSIVMLVINPPELEPETFSVARMVTGLMTTHAMSVHTLVWILFATMFFELQRRGRPYQA